MADIKVKYPSSSTTDLTITLASLADDNTNAIAGRASTAVDNTSNVDLDHLLTGKITTGTSPTASRTIEVWVYAPRSLSTGTPTYPDSITGTDAAKTFTSRNVLINACKLAATVVIDATSDRTYDIAPVSVASLFGGYLPQFWGVWVLNRSGAALNATGSNQALSYSRVQMQSV